MEYTEVHEQCRYCLGTAHEGRCLEELEIELKSREAEVSRLKERIEEFDAPLDEVISKKDAEVESQRKRLHAASKEADGYESLLKKKDAEIERLKAEIDKNSPDHFKCRLSYETYQKLADEEIERLKAEVAEWNAWRKGQRGIEEYYALKAELSDLKANLTLERMIKDACQKTIMSEREELKGYKQRYDDERAGHLLACQEHEKELAKEREAASVLVNQLRKSRVRLEILLGRARGCDEGKIKRNHVVSEIEVPGWIEEIDDLLATHAQSRKESKI